MAQKRKKPKDALGDNTIRMKKRSVYDALKDRKRHNSTSNPETGASVVFNEIAHLIYRRLGWPKNEKPSTSISAETKYQKDQASGVVGAYGSGVDKRFNMTIKRKTKGQTIWFVGFDSDPICEFDPEDPKTISKFFDKVRDLYMKK